jgi:hypothetical protein
MRVESLDAYRRHCVWGPVPAGLIRSKLYAVNCSGIRPEMRVVQLLCLQKDGPLWVNWCLRCGNESERGTEGEVVLAMVDEIRQIAGEKAIEWLLMDDLNDWEGFVEAAQDLGLENQA